MTVKICNKRTGYSVLVIAICLGTTAIIYKKYVMVDENDPRYWSTQWFSDVPANQAKALAWCAQDYLRLEMDQAEVENILGVGNFEIAQEGWVYWYDEPGSGLSLLLRYVKRDGRFVLVAWKMKKKPDEVSPSAPN